MYKILAYKIVKEFMISKFPKAYIFVKHLI